MKRKCVAVAVLLCLLLGACGRAEWTQGDSMTSNQEDLLPESGEKPEEEEKKALELAVWLYGDDIFLNESIERFNQQSSEYRIVLRDRPEDIYWEDYYTGLREEISAGGGPDLFVTSIVGIEDGATQGYMRDLTEDFADLKGEMLESAWNNGIRDEKLYTIPYAFQLNTLSVEKNIVGDKTSWTLEELMQITRESGVDALMNAYFYGPNLFYYLGIFTEGNSGLIDWENKISCLNSPEAVALLEFSAEYGNTGDDEDGMEGVEQTVLVTWESIFQLQDMQDYEPQPFADAVDEKIYIGWPVENGECQHMMECSDIAVNQACEYPEGAVEFLRFLVSEETQGQIVEHQTQLQCGFPVREDSLKLMFDKAMDGYYNDDATNVTEQSLIMGDEEVLLQPISKESIDKLWSIIENAKPKSNRAEAVFDMIYEETESYFAGDKSAQEVLDILQNRVQLYLDGLN